MLCVQHQGYIQHLCLQLRILAVLSKQTQDILRCGQIRFRIPDNQAFIQMIMTVRMITVDRIQRELGNQL